MFSRNEWDKLLTTLYVRTEKGEIKWEGDGGGPGYTQPIDDHTVISIRGVDGDGRAPYELNVWRRPEGSETFTKFGTITTHEFYDHSDRVGELYELIVRKINDVDVIFDSIMTKLKSPEDR